jgi:protein-tyrosine-phosphatase
MKVLFICRANVGRSQMATAFFNKLSTKHHAVGAGTHVGDNEGLPLQELVIKCMAELGYDLSKETRKQLTRKIAHEADSIIVMNEKEDVPPYLSDSPKVMFWEVEDAKGTSYDFHVKIRDQIKGLVEKLVREIG